MSRVIHLLALSLAFAFGIIGLGAGINAHVKEGNDKDRAKDTASPLGIDVDVNTHDIDSVGAVLLTGCALLALFSFIFLITFSFLRRGPHKFEGWIFAFLSVWLLACNIGHTVIAADHSAKVTAMFANGSPVPDALVQQAQKLSGISPVYWDQNYVRFYTIVTWITFLTAVFAAVTSFHGARQKKVEKA